MDRERVTARARRLKAQAHPMPLNPKGDWHGRCSRCGEVVSGTVQEIIKKHKNCKPPHPHPWIGWLRALLGRRTDG